jgi:hypothetical protein
VFGGSSLVEKRPAGAKKRASALSDASNRRYSEEKKEDGLSSSDESDELEIVGVRNTTTTSRHFQQEKKAATTAAARMQANDSDDSNDDHWFKPNNKKRPASSNALGDSSDEDIPVRSHSGGTFGMMSPGDYVDDSDEEHALLLATEASMDSGNGNRKKKRLKKKKKKKAKSRVTVELSASEEEGGSPADAMDEELLAESSDGGEDEQEEYQDKDAAEAVSVLKAANELSAKVIQSMTGWSAEKDGESVPTGIIVDGALSLLECGQSNASSHSWISQEVMQKVCPQVTLADYQLIGVNWLALLHGLTCDVDGKKGGTNVNGVLAGTNDVKAARECAVLCWN